MGDWKETLFFWQGELTTDAAGSRPRLTWKGAWEGVDAPGVGAASPQSAEIAASPTTFELHAEVGPASAGGQAPDVEALLRRQPVLSWSSGSYLLDNGDGVWTGTLSWDTLSGACPRIPS